MYFYTISTHEKMAKIFYIFSVLFKVKICLTSPSDCGEYLYCSNHKIVDIVKSAVALEAKR